MKAMGLRKVKKHARRASCAMKHTQAGDGRRRLATKMYNICVNTAFLENIDGSQL